MVTRTLFIKLSESPTMRALVEKRGWSFASRFVAGRTLDEAIQVVRTLNNRGIYATLSHLGEHITDASVARREVDVFREIVTVLDRERLQCGLSVKPSQIGTMIDWKMAEQNILDVTRAAAEYQRFVRIDMEDHTTTDATLEMVRNIHAQSPNIGLVIQAYLRRSKADINALNDQRISVRLCKGAYNEPASIAFPTKAEVDENYVLLTKLLMHNGYHPAIATHDETMIRATIQIAKEDLVEAGKVVPRPNTDTSSWEFQMLYGIRRNLQASLVDQGYHVRIYVPYGTEWYPYFMRRLAERPANIGFVLRNLFKG